MKEKRSFRLPGALLLLILSWSVSCKEPDDTGIIVLPPEDSVHAFFTDTMTIEGRTLVVDSLFSENTSLSLLGEYVDEEFGIISSSFWTQLHATGDNIVFGDTTSLTLDSVVLSLNLEGFYGSYEYPMTVQVFEIMENFPEDDTLETIDSLAVGSIDYANGFTIDFSGQSNPSDILNIKLDPAIGNKILHAHLDSLVNNATFQSFFKGLHVRAKSNGFNSREPGGIFAIDLLTKSGLTLFYKDHATVKNYTFKIDGDSRRFHNFHRGEFSTKLLAQTVLDTVSPVNFQIQAGALVKFFVKIPHLESLSPVGVNRAELILKVDEDLLGSGDRFLPPSKIFLYRADSTGTKEKGIPYSASYDPASHSYTVDITLFTMAMINGTVENYGFLISPNDINITVNRAVLGGPGHATLAPRLKLIYTNIPN